MSDKISSDINNFEPGDIIELFELDISTGSAPSTSAIFRWHPGVNEHLQEIVWQGNRYSAFPIEAEGFEFSGTGTIPKPLVTIANITSVLSGYLTSYDDLVGAKLTRKRTLAKYLDSYCKIGGITTGGVCTGESGGSASISKTDCLDATKNGSAGTWVPYDTTICTTASGIWYANSTEDSTASFPDEIWYVERKAVETNTHIQFELSSAHDVQGVKLPGRTIVANSCPWAYKGVECGYSGQATAIATIASEAVTAITVVEPGNLYSIDPAYIHIGSDDPDSGSGATFSLTIASGSVSAVSVTAGGSGYDSEDITVLVIGGGGSGSSLTATVVSGVITAITIVDGGTGYITTSTATVSITGGGGSGATAVVALVTSGAISTITVTAGGSGYTTVPSVSITGSGDRLWDIDNNVVSSSSDDVCGKTFISCELRFPDTGPSPFGGFPGAGLNMGRI
jgi:phage-related protein